METIIFKKEEIKTTEIPVFIDAERCFFTSRHDKINAQVDAYIGRVEIDGVFYTVQWYRNFATIFMSSTLGERQAINKLPFQEFINKYPEYKQITKGEFLKAYEAMSEDYLINGKF